MRMLPSYNNNNNNDDDPMMRGGPPQYPSDAMMDSSDDFENGRLLYRNRHKDSRMVDEDHFYLEGGLDLQRSCMTWQTFMTMILTLFCLFFSGLVIYSLGDNNTDAVKNACPNLFPYMLTRTVLGLCTAFCMCLYKLFCTPEDQSVQSPVIAFFFVYFLALAIYGGVVVSQNMIGDTTCTNALYDETFQSPLLGVLGWIFVVCDALFAFGTLCVLYYYYISMYTNNGMPFSINKKNSFLGMSYPPSSNDDQI